MIPLLLKKVVVQLAHLLHARLSPLRFLLTLTLLTSLLRILNLLTLNASSPTLHTLLISTTQGFNLNLNPFILNIDLVLFLVANFIILALFFTSRARGTSSPAMICQYASILDGFTDTDTDDDDDADKPYDTLAQYIPNELPIASAPSIELHSSYGRYSYIPTAPSMELAASNSLCEYNTLAIATPSDSILSNQLEILPILGPISIESANPKSLIRHKSDTKVRNQLANKYKFYGRTVSCTHYYDTRDEACSTARLYTASTIDSLTKEEANKHFSEFVSRKWAGMRMET